jgi:lipooligosaccharide transport system ATP-binding protein
VQLHEVSGSNASAPSYWNYHARMTVAPAPEAKGFVAHRFVQTVLQPAPACASVDAVVAHALTKRFGSFVAVDAIDLIVPNGVCYGLLGPNGAGKTTTIRLLQGVSPRDGGQLNVLGLDPATSARALKARLGVVPQEDNLDPDFTVRGNLLVHARYYGIKRAEARSRAARWLKFVQLEEKARARIATLSGGMKRRLVVARALMNDPDLLVLDEPTTGLDPQARHLIWDKIRELRRAGKTILLTTHYMDEAEMLCDRLVVVDHGKILVEGKPRELVREHCGTEAAEFVARDGDTASLDQLVARLQRAKVRHDRLPDRVVAFGENLGPLAARMESLGLAEIIIRRASLEDVFLRLTGRGLRD